MGGAYGRKLATRFHTSNSTACSLMEMVVGSDFGRMRSVVRTPCVRSFLLFTLWLTLRVLGFKRLGSGQGRWGVGILVL